MNKTIYELIQDRELFSKLVEDAAQEATKEQREMLEAAQDE